MFATAEPEQKRKRLLECRNASCHGGGFGAARNAILGFFVGCCASTGTLSPKSNVLRTELIICFFMFLVMPVTY